MSFDYGVFTADCTVSNYVLAEKVVVSTFCFAGKVSTPFNIMKMQHFFFLKVYSLVAH